MNTPKKASSTPKRFVPTEDHQITIGEAHQIISSSTFTVYGRLIGDLTISPAQAGLPHPQGTEEDLQLALIFGIEEDGNCSAVNPPQTVYMPTPDGPADGCGWDPKQYVMWKNLSKNWITIHVQSTPKTIATALAPMAADQGPRFLSDVMCLDWMKLGATVFIDPAWTLQAVWVKLHGGDYTFAQQVSLSNAIRDAYNGKTIDPKNLTATTTVQTVANWIPASV